MRDLITLFALLGFGSGALAAVFEIREVKQITSAVRNYQPQRAMRPPPAPDLAAGALGHTRWVPVVPEETVDEILAALRLATATSWRTTWSQRLAIAAGLFGVAATLIAVWW